MLYINFGVILVKFEEDIRNGGMRQWLGRSKFDTAERGRGVQIMLCCAESSDRLTPISI